MSHLRVEGSMAHLSIRVLGPLQVTLDGQPVAGFESDKARGLLVYLAVEAERRQTREKLAGLLWPDWLERSARSNLRRALANLRQVIGDDQASPPFLHISRQAIQFNSASDAWVDVSEFTGLVDAGASARDPSRQTVDRLEKAIALYRGEFLDGFSVADSAAFEEWISINRERANRQMVDGLYCLADCYEGYGEYEKALQHAWRQLELNPWREKAHRQVMRLLALSGQRGAALAHYETCRRLLDEELGVEPAAETRKLCEQIRGDKLEPPVSFSSRSTDSHAKLPSSLDRLRSKRLSVSLYTALVAILGTLILLGIGLLIVRQGDNAPLTEAGTQLPSASSWSTPTPLVPLPVPVALYDEECADHRSFLEEDVQDAGGMVVKPGAEQMRIEVRCDGDRTTIEVHFPETPAYPIEFLDDAALVLSIETEIAYGRSFIQAAVAYAGGDYFAATSKLDDIILNSPSFDVCLLRAQARLHQEDWSGAVEDYTSSLDGWPEANAARHARAYAGRGLARLLHRQLKGSESSVAVEECKRYAADDFGSAMMAQPDRPLWLAGRALARTLCPGNDDYDVIGDIDDAVEQTKETDDADEAIILGTSALIYCIEGNYAKAKTEADSSIALVDVFPTPYLVLHIIYSEDAPEKAFEAYRDYWMRSSLPLQRLRAQEMVDFP
jgi:DNA-binding SARP family transcriptional activator